MKFHQIWSIQFIFVGSGCGSVGRAVASDSRGPRFKFGHQQNFIWNIYCQLFWKDENKEKEAGNGPFLQFFFKICLQGTTTLVKLVLWELTWPILPNLSEIPTRSSSLNIA